MAIRDFLLAEKTLKALKKVFTTIAFISQFNHGSTASAERSKRSMLNTYLQSLQCYPISILGTEDIPHMLLNLRSTSISTILTPRDSTTQSSTPVHRSSAPQRYVAPTQHSYQPFRYNPAYSVGLPTAIEGSKLPKVALEQAVIHTIYQIATCCPNLLYLGTKKSGAGDENAIS